MLRLLFGLASLCFLAACDSNEPSIALDGTWARRDSVLFYSTTGAASVRGTREDRYTFATRGNQITGSHLAVDRDRQETILRQNEASVTGEILSDTRFTITEGAPPYSYTYSGTATETEIRLFLEDSSSPQVPFVVLRRP